MKLPTNSYCADVASKGSLELGSECCNRGKMILHATHFSIRRSRSVSLCGLPLCGWAVVAPWCLHFTITALTVDRGCSSRADIWQTDLLERWASFDGATLKVTELFSKGHSTANVCRWGLHGCVLDWIHLSETGVAEKTESTNLKWCPHTFVYIGYH